MNSIHLEHVRNVRDLGGIPVDGNRHVVHGVFFRGGALNKMSDADTEMLFEKLGIRCVIDLRCGWELEDKPEKDLPAFTTYGVEYAHIPYYDNEIVGIEYTEPHAGTKVIGRDIACNPDHYYRSLANPLTVGQMRQAVECAFRQASGGNPVYGHCSGGKDRAGILSALILYVLGASHDAILEDYMVTNESRDKQYQANFERFLKLADGNVELASKLVESHRARPQNLAAFREEVCEAYGSVADFVRNQIGVTDQQKEELREAFTRED